MENKQVEIKISDNFLGGEYANAMKIIHNKDEVLMNFLNITPPNGRVVAKIITTPGHLKRIIRALQDNIEKYEKTFGEIKESDSPDKTIGFTDKKDS